MKAWYLLLIILCSCSQSSRTEKYRDGHSQTVNVKSKVKGFVKDDILIGNVSPLQLVGDYLMIGDVMSHEHLIHIFDKNDFTYVKSILHKGEGPDEITNMGYIGTDSSNQRFYLSDHGKQKVFVYDIDSVLTDSLYKPAVKIKMNKALFPSKYKYINDSLTIALSIKPIGNSGYSQSLTYWNMNTGEAGNLLYEHPEIKKKRVAFDVSVKNGIYVECYLYHDLITICDLQGNLKYNVYGPRWDTRVTNKVSYYNHVTFCKDKIVVLYSGEDTFYNSRSQGVRVKYPTKFFIFNLEGDYIQTLETEYHIIDFCYDEENNRVIMALDDEPQFAYLDMEGFI